MEQLNLNYSIKSSKNILIISHVNPDGDTLGSMLALRDLIHNSYKKKPEMMVISKVPKIYEFLKGINEVKHLSQYDNSRVYDLVILVDVAALDRIFDAQILFDKAKIKAVIDHHKTNNYDANIKIVDGDASSTGEILYKVAKENNWKFDKNIAESLYTAILTDTGGFRFDNTKAITLEIASKLVEMGVKPLWVYKNCYEMKTKEFVIFQAYALNKAEFSSDDKIAYITLYKKDIEKFGNGEDFTEGLVERLRTIETTEVAFILKEIDNKMFKVSMRSKKLDVAEVCAAFGGGGHKFAAGCVLKYSANECVKKLIAEIDKQRL